MRVVGMFIDPGYDFIDRVSLLGGLLKGDLDMWKNTERLGAYWP